MRTKIPFTAKEIMCGNAKKYRTKKSNKKKNIKKQNERRTEAKEYREAKQRMEPNSSPNTHIHINSIQLNTHPAKKKKN